MAISGVEAYALSKTYVEDILRGITLIEGKPCKIYAIDEIEGGKRITFKWTADDGTEKTSYMTVMDGEKGDKGDQGEQGPQGEKGDEGDKGDKGDDGLGIKSVAINAQNHLIITYDDDTTEDAGEIPAGTGAVSSVNGQTGTVVLDADDVGAVAKETGKGLSENDYTNADKAEVAKVANKADADDVIDGVSYDSTNHQILFKNGTTTLFSLDAAAFVKDGMVDDVEIDNGNLVITFNTDAGKQAISIPLTDIFDPANYYDKDDVDGLLADKADQTEVNDIVNVYGAKNLIPYPYLNKSEIEFRGVTYTVNADGSITANGTATGGDSAFFILQRNFDNDFLSKIGQGHFILSGCPASGSLQTYYLNFNYGDAQSSVGNLGQDTGNGKEIVIDTDITQYNAQITVLIREGVTVSDLTFYPMLRMASIEDDTFVLYAKTNRELTIDEAEQQAEINDIVNVYSSKNLLSYPYYETSHTESGITFTDLGDGTIKANGTATADSVFLCHFRTNMDSNNLVLPNGKYILSGCPSGGASSKYLIGANRTLNGAHDLLGADFGDGVEITLNGDDYSADKVDIGVYVQIKNGATVNNLIFKPMIRLASVKDNTYVPYVPTNAKLDEKKVSYDDASESVQKNLNSYPYVETTKTSNGITFTDLGDGTIKVNGTATADAVLSCHIRAIGTTHPLFIPNGKYVISGCPSGGSSSTYMVGTAITKNGSAFLVALDYGDGREFTLNGDDTYTDKVQLQIQIVIKSGQTVNNLVFKPMLRKATIKDDAWQPYIPTNAELQKNKVPYEVASGVQGKNLLTTPYWTGAGVKYGITFTINDDGSVTANGTADSDNNVYFNFQVNDLPSSLALEEGQTYTLSGCPTGGNVNTYSMIVRNVNPSTDIATDTGNGVTFKYNNTSISTPKDKPTIAIRIIKGTTVSNLTFKPMLEIGAIAHAYDPTPSDANYDSNAVHETITGKKWIDGKTIYRKVVDCGALPNATTKDVAHGIIGIDTVVSIYGMATSPSLNTHFPLPYPNTDSTNSVVILVIGANVHIVDAYDFSGYTAKVILEYTKTTD